MCDILINVFAHVSRIELSGSERQCPLITRGAIDSLIRLALVDRQSDSRGPPGGKETARSAGGRVEKKRRELKLIDGKDASAGVDRERTAVAHSPLSSQLRPG